MVHALPGRATAWANALATLPARAAARATLPARATAQPTARANARANARATERATARAIGAIALALATLAAPPHADAHLGNLSYADLEARGNQVLLQFKYATHITPGVPADQASPTTRAQVLALEGAIANWLDDTTQLDSGGKRCRLGIENIVGPDSNDDLQVIALWTCEVPEVKGIRLNFHPLSAAIKDWQTIVSLRMGGQAYSTVLSEGATRWQVGEAGPAADPRAEESVGDDDGSASAFSRFFELGVEHIWTGYDHLLFLLAVLLAGGGIGRLAAIVTSFTIAHSITLGAAATGLVQLPVEPVEAVIALSIVYVAVENLLGRGADRRALVTFAFGLIHGFGFASVLSETALPAGSIVVPLLAFNLGVEAGQLAVVIVVVPILALVMRGSRASLVKNTLSILVALAGAAWAIERITAILS